ncbi:MAG TPA: allantoinase AllB [Gemmatimonadales bacterium]|nr:allantoinase AllB [Gemmatimonadales bacterium]
MTPTADLVVASDRIITPDGERPGAVVVSNGTITGIVPREAAPAAHNAFDAGTAALLPGIVDTHVHLNEPGRTDWEGFATGTRAAAAGGVTTIVDMPLNSVPVTTNVVALRQKAAAAHGVALVDYGFWGGVVPGNAADLAPLLDAGALGFKVFLVPSGIDEFPMTGSAELTEAMTRIAEHDAVLLVHAEAPEVIEQATRDASGDPRRYATWLASRPVAAELEGIERVLELSARTGCRVHIVHLACVDGIARLKAARRSGVRVTVETCPHYLSFAAEDVADGATAFKCAPPIRERAHRDGLWHGLEHGDIDLVASDHSPSPPALKCLDSGNFMTAWGGIASLEIALAAVWTGARERGRSLLDVARWMSRHPALLAGLTRKGRIAAGCDADLVVFDPDRGWTVDPQTLRQRHPVTPYAGLALRGRVLRTFVRGMCVYDGARCVEPARGRWLVRERR